MTLAPLDIGFNIAVRSIAARLFPCGYDVTADEAAAPSTLAQLNACIAETGRLTVWTGASDATIYACPETNWAARAWHDWTHWRYQLPFTLAGEGAVAERQCEALALVYPGHESLERWQTIVRLEVVAQATWFTFTGAFPADQRAFVMERLAA